MYPLRIIDSLSPFFYTLCKTSPPVSNSEVNWSKTPFHLIEQALMLEGKGLKKLTDCFRVYLQRAAAYGFNAVTLDDLAHMVSFQRYPAELRVKLEQYATLYKKLYATARNAGFAVYINTDILFYNKSVDSYTNGKFGNQVRFFITAIRRLFTQYPETAGVVCRIGESDGIDVQGDFKSILCITTPKECRYFLNSVLPEFENLEKNLIFRAWTLGAYTIGDLMWNAGTFRKVFKNINSDNLRISLKFGETDFFRYLNFNKLFFTSRQPMIIELQTRREYEGFGKFPSFIGKDYERYSTYLKKCKKIKGLLVWCQTGGWSHFTACSLLSKNSIWNDINTFCAINIINRHWSSEKSVREYVKRYPPGVPAAVLYEILRVSESAVKQLWYIPEFARQRLYFRRSRVPPLLYIFWDHILITSLMRKILRRSVHERREAVIDGQRALKMVKHLKKLSSKHNFHKNQFALMYDTFYIISLSREFYFGQDAARAQKKLISFHAVYKEKWPYGFHIDLGLEPFRLHTVIMKFFFHFALRPHPHYRMIDKLFIIPFSMLMYRFIRLWYRQGATRFFGKQAMGIQALLK